MTVWDLILHLNSWCLSTLLITGYVPPSSEITALFNISAAAVLGTLPSEMLHHFSLRFHQYSTHLPSSQFLSLDFCSDLHYIKKTKQNATTSVRALAEPASDTKERKYTALHTACTDGSIILRLHLTPMCSLYGCIFQVSAAAEFVCSHSSSYSWGWCLTWMSVFLVVFSFKSRWCKY